MNLENKSFPETFGSASAAPYLANTLTPYVADANVHTPEFKAFLVDVEKA